MTDRLHAKRCLIVGGTSGIGLVSARRFLEEGAALVVAGLPDDGATLALPSQVPQVMCDATDPKHIEGLLQQTIALLGGLDVLYHVAGSSGRRHGDGALHECTDAGWHATLEANLTCTFLTNRAAVCHFLAHGQPGVILNMASALPLAPSPQHFGTIAYTTAKGAILAMSRQLAARYAVDGIRVNVLAPGLIDTPMATRATHDPAIQHYLRTKQPLAAGPGRPEDCAEAAVFLCSDESRFLTGVVLPVDGGWCVSEGQYGSGETGPLQ